MLMEMLGIAAPACALVRDGNFLIYNILPVNGGNVYRIIVNIFLWIKREKGLTFGEKTVQCDRKVHTALSRAVEGTAL